MQHTLYGITTWAESFNFNYDTCFQMFLFCNFCFLMFTFYFAYRCLPAFLLESQSEGKGREFNIKLTFTSFDPLALSRLYHVNFLPHLREDLSKMASDPISPKSLGSCHSVFKTCLTFLHGWILTLWFLSLIFFPVTSSRLLLYTKTFVSCISSCFSSTGA